MEQVEYRGYRFISAQKASTHKCTQMKLMADRNNTWRVMTGTTAGCSSEFVHPVYPDQLQHARLRLCISVPGAFLLK